MFPDEERRTSSVLKERILLLYALLRYVLRGESRSTLRFGRCITEVHRTSCTLNGKHMSIHASNSYSEIYSNNKTLVYPLTLYYNITQGKKRGETI